MAAPSCRGSLGKSPHDSPCEPPFPPVRVQDGSESTSAARKPVSLTQAASERGGVVLRRRSPARAPKSARADAVPGQAVQGHQPRCCAFQVSLPEHRMQLVRVMKQEAARTELARAIITTQQRARRGPDGSVAGSAGSRGHPFGPRAFAEREALGSRGRLADECPPEGGRGRRQQRLRGRRRNQGCPADGPGLGRPVRASGHRWVVAVLDQRLATGPPRGCCEPRQAEPVRESPDWRTAQGEPGPEPGESVTQPRRRGVNP